MNKQNKIFGIDGSNGVGKSTVIKIILSLIGDVYNFDSVRFPGETVEGRVIRKLLLSEDSLLDPTAEFFLFAADNIQTWNLELLPRLADTSFLTDRTWLSSYAFQGAIGVDKEFITNISRPRSPYDRIYLLDAPFSIVYDRCSKDERIEQRNINLLKSSHENFEKVDDQIAGCPVVRIDATQNAMQVATDIYKDIMQVMDIDNV
jgi:dTMP kinase